MSAEPAVDADVAETGLLAVSRCQVDRKIGWHFVPRAASTVPGPCRVVAFGWSMGGYGSLLLAETYPTRIGRVGAMSPAIWPSYAGSQNANPNAFNSRADRSAHDVVGHLDELDHIPVRIDCGSSDPFIPASRQLATLLPGDVYLSPGGHDLAFWSAHAPM